MEKKEKKKTDGVKSKKKSRNPEEKTSQSQESKWQEFLHRHSKVKEEKK